MDVAPKTSRKITRRGFLRAAGFGSASAVATLAYGDITSSRVEVVRRSLTVPRWDADEIRVGVLADLHLDDADAVERASAAVRLTIKEQPDLIVCVGDYLTSSSTGRLQNVQKTMSVLNEFPGPVLGILGNHDYSGENISRLVNGLRSSKMRLLRNEMIEVQGVRIWGLDDALQKQYRPDLVTGDKNTLVLLHEPDYVSEVPDGPSLQISGHSHGGQICLPGGYAVHTPKGARKFIAGFYQDQVVPVYVSRGIGTTGPNWRMFCPPEASILTLKGS